MKEKSILKLAFIITILGIAVLYIMTETIEIESLKDPYTDLGKYVKISGIVTKVSQTEKTTFIEITEPRKMKVIFFKNISLEKGDLIEAQGNIEMYNDEFELVADRVVKK